MFGFSMDSINYIHTRIALAIVNKRFGFSMDSINYIHTRIARNHFFFLYWPILPCPPHLHLRNTWDNWMPNNISNFGYWINLKDPQEKSKKSHIFQIHDVNVYTFHLAMAIVAMQINTWTRAKMNKKMWSWCNAVMEINGDLPWF